MHFRKYVILFVCFSFSLQICCIRANQKYKPQKSSQNISTVVALRDVIRVDKKTRTLIISGRTHINAIKNILKFVNLRCISLHKMIENCFVGDEVFSDVEWFNELFSVIKRTNVRVLNIGKFKIPDACLSNVPKELVIKNMQ